MRDAFLMDLATLEEFYTRCMKVNANTEAEKATILMELWKEKKAVHLGQTDKSAPELATEFIKKGIKARSIGYKADKPLTNDPSPVIKKQEDKKQ